MIDAKLQAELRAKYNPDGSDLRNMQLRMLDMLKYIDQICRENNIKYWLSSGTCLGAVRHGGFIPWDDDCDIEMRREDYNRLIKVLRTECKNKQFKLQDIKTEDKYFLPFAKLRDTKSHIFEEGAPNYEYDGCWIDIFPLERNSKWAMKLSAKIHTVLLNPNFRYHISNAILEKILINFYFHILTPLIRFFNCFTNKDYLYHTYGVCFYKERYAEDIREVVYKKFENLELPIPRNYHHYLTSIYGNYDSIPAAGNKIAYKFVDVNIF